MSVTTDSTQTKLEVYIKAQRFYRELMQGHHDPEDAFYLFTEQYPDISPEWAEQVNDHERESRNRYQRAKALLWGRKRNGEYKGGTVGRLRALIGVPLQQSVLHFRQIPELRPLQYDEFSLYADEQMEYIKGVLAIILPQQCWYSVEMGRHAGLHAHILHAEGDKCPGSTLHAPIPDDELLDRLGYFAKDPYFDFDSNLGYMTVRQSKQGGPVATRQVALGLDPRKVNINLRQIEEVCGKCPASEDMGRICPESQKQGHGAYTVLASPTYQQLEEGHGTYPSDRAA